MHIALLAVCLTTTLAAGVYGQSGGPTWVMKGCVVDRTNDEPLMFVKVCVQGTPVPTVTDTLGCFTLDHRSDPGERRTYLIVEYNGFERHTCRIKRKDLDRGRVHRLKRIKFGPDPPVIKIRD